MGCGQSTDGFSNQGSFTMPSRNTAALMVVASMCLSTFVSYHYVHQMRNIAVKTNTDLHGVLRQVFAAKEANNNIQLAPMTKPPQSLVPCTPAPEYNFENADQLDPRLIEYIRKEVLVPPSPHNYSLKNPELIHYSQEMQSQYANEKFLHGMKGGFFVEVGAWDGEFLSNSLFFERQLGWRGLLIEANGDRFKQLLAKGRNAYLANVAVAITTKAGYVKFESSSERNGINLQSDVEVKAFPLISLLLALDVKVVDFISLDIESFEVKVLKTIPWDKIRFRLMCIEVNHIPEGIEYLTKFLKEKGYVFLSNKNIDNWYGHSDFFPVKRKV